MAGPSCGSSSTAPAGPRPRRAGRRHPGRVPGARRGRPHRRPLHARGHQPRAGAPLRTPRPLRPGGGRDGQGQGPSRPAPRRRGPPGRGRRPRRPTTTASSCAPSATSAPGRAHGSPTTTSSGTTSSGARTTSEWGERRRQTTQRRAHEPDEKRDQTVMSEMMEALQALAAEKGISVDTLMAALADALESAYKRMPGAHEYAWVTIDPDQLRHPRLRPGDRRGRRARTAPSSTSPPRTSAASPPRRRARS